MQTFLTGLIFFALLSGSFLWLNRSQTKRVRAMEVTGDEDGTTERFLAWQQTKLSALRWGRIGWVMVFFVGVAVLPWLRTIVPLLAIAAFVVAAVYHDSALRKMKKLPAYLSQGIREQQGIYRFAWALPAVLFGGIALVGLQKVSRMIYAPSTPVAQSTVEPKKIEDPADSKEAVQPAAEAAAEVPPVKASEGIADKGADGDPSAKEDPFAE